MHKIDKILLILTLIIGCASLVKAAVDYTRLASPITVIPLLPATTGGVAYTWSGDSRAVSPCTEPDQVYLPSMPEWSEAYLLLESYHSNNDC